MTDFSAQTVGKVTLYSMPAEVSHQYASRAAVVDDAVRSSVVSRGGLVETSVSHLVWTTSSGPVRSHLAVLMGMDENITIAWWPSMEAAPLWQTVGFRPMGTLEDRKVAQKKLEELDLSPEVKQAIAEAIQVTIVDMKERLYVQGQMGLTAA